MLTLGNGPHPLLLELLFRKEEENFLKGPKDAQVKTQRCRVKSRLSLLLPDLSLGLLGIYSAKSSPSAPLEEPTLQPSQTSVHYCVIPHAMGSLSLDPVTIAFKKEKRKCI